MNNNNAQEQEDVPDKDWESFLEMTCEPMIPAQRVEEIVQFVKEQYPDTDSSSKQKPNG